MIFLIQCHIYFSNDFLIYRKTGYNCINYRWKWRFLFGNFASGRRQSGIGRSLICISRRIVDYSRRQRWCSWWRRTRVLGRRTWCLRQKLTTIQTNKHWHLHISHLHKFTVHFAYILVFILGEDLGKYSMEKHRVSSKGLLRSTSYLFAVMKEQFLNYCLS